MDIVSFETAKRLKDAGFPQPELHCGQVWYSKKRAYFLFYKKSGEAYFCPINTKYGVKRIWEDEGHKFINELIFAPTATDIMQHESMFVIALIYLASKDKKKERSWSIQNVPIDDDDCVEYSDHPNNSAEAAAAAWLSLNATEFKMEITGNLDANA